MLVCLALDEQFTIVIFSCFCLRLGHRKGLEGTTYPAIDLSVCGQSDGIKFALVED